MLSAHPALANPSTPHDRFVLTLFGGLTQMERELIAERTRKADLEPEWIRPFGRIHCPPVSVTRGDRSVNDVSRKLHDVSHLAQGMFT